MAASSFVMISLDSSINVSKHFQNLYVPTTRKTVRALQVKLEKYNLQWFVEQKSKCVQLITCQIHNYT